MNAFTDTRKLIDTKIYKKSENARKGGVIRANAEGGAAVKFIGNHQPHKREIMNDRAKRSV
jgi:hypothetical protein